MYTHLWKFAEENRTVGLFAESAFESIHARYNAIERRYNHIISLELRDVAIRQALVLQQDREARAACATQHAAVARGPRAATYKMGLQPRFFWHQLIKRGDPQHISLRCAVEPTLSVVLAPLSLDDFTFHPRM
jgi:hypothetical protein